MLCSKCKTKPVARGIKSIKCLCCNKNTIVNVAHHICSDCSDKLSKCQYCGKEISCRK